MSLRAIAAGLNARGIPTARGIGPWSATKVCARWHGARYKCQEPDHASHLLIAPNGARETVRDASGRHRWGPTATQRCWMTNNLLILRCDIDHRRAYLFEPLRFCKGAVGNQIPTRRAVLVLDRLQLGVDERRAVDRAALRVLASRLEHTCQTYRLPPVVVVLDLLADSLELGAQVHGPQRRALQRTRLSKRGPTPGSPTGSNGPFSFGSS